jgi:hypothetical protein
MKIYKKIGIGLLLIIGLLIILGTWYKYAFSMDEATSMEINSPNLEQKILIATQGSEFKDEVTVIISEHYTLKPVFIKVTDVKGLTEIDPNDYNAIIVIHTWENGKPPLVVAEFIERNMVYKEKIVMLSTSGNGSFKMTDVDAISGESILKNAETLSEKVIHKVDAILAK